MSLYRGYFSPGGVDPMGWQTERSYPPGFGNKEGFPITWNNSPGYSEFDWRRYEIQINPDLTNQADIWADVVHEHVAGMIYHHMSLEPAR